jgi:hypothetical protein
MYDPAPTNVGSNRHVNFNALMTQFPMATMYVLQR